MIARFSTILLASIAYASPILEVRTVDSLNQDAFKEAQVRDDTATRAFSGIAIKTSDGRCLFIDELSGDFRANLNPIQVAACDGSTGQQWDIITKGKHNDQAGTILVVNGLTQACMNFDPRRAAGNQVNTFSCGGRADGGGDVTPSQLFTYNGGAGPLSLEPKNQAGTCFTVTSGNVLDQAACNNGDVSQLFTFGGDGAADPVATTTTAAETSSVVDTPAATTAPAVETSSIVDTPAATSEPAAETSTTPEAVATTPGVEATTPAAACVSTTLVTMTRFVDVTTSAAAETLVADPISSAEAVVTSAPRADAVGANPTTPVPVSGAGGVLNPSAAAKANAFDDTATRALTSVSIKTSGGKCLFIDPTAGDFRENLIPIAVQDCTGAAGEKFDFVTKGKHNDGVDLTLIVSSLMNGCMTFDPRRQVNAAHIFSCGGRGDGEGDTSNSQQFPFTAGQTTTITLAPKNEDGKTCLVDVGGRLDQAACSGDASQLFTIG